MINKRRITIQDIKDIADNPNCRLISSLMDELINKAIYTETFVNGEFKMNYKLNPLKISKAGTVMIISIVFLRGRCIEIAVKHFLVVDEFDVKKSMDGMKQEVKDSSGHENNIIAMNVYYLTIGNLGAV